MKRIFVTGVVAAGMWVGAAIAPSSVSILRYVGFSDVYAGSCDIDDNLDDTVQTFVGRCVNGSAKSVMPDNMWSRTLRDVRDNRSRDDDYKTCWKLISRSEYRK